jgi:hypothetical protein
MGQIWFFCFLEPRSLICQLVTLPFVTCLLTTLKVETYDFKVYIGHLVHFIARQQILNGSMFVNGVSIFFESGKHVHVTPPH